MIYLGIAYIVVGLLFFAHGIKSEIPRPNKGYHFIYVEDGYVINPHLLKHATYDDGKEVNVLTMEKEAQ